MGISIFYIFSLSLLDFRTSANWRGILWIPFVYTSIQISWCWWTSCWPSLQVQQRWGGALGRYNSPSHRCMPRSRLRACQISWSFSWILQTLTTLTPGKLSVYGVQEHRLQPVMQDRIQIAHQTQKANMKVISNMTDVDLIIQHSRNEKNIFSKAWNLKVKQSTVFTWNEKGIWYLPGIQSKSLKVGFPVTF